MRATAAGHVQLHFAAMGTVVSGTTVPDAATLPAAAQALLDQSRCAATPCSNGIMVWRWWGEGEPSSTTTPLPCRRPTSQGTACVRASWSPPMHAQSPCACGNTSSTASGAARTFSAVAVGSSHAACKASPHCACVALVPDADHWVQYEQAQAFNQLLAAWARRT